MGRGRTERDAELAKTEMDKIAYLEKRMRYDYPESVLSIYNKAIENGIFQTPVGFQYLQKLKGFLVEQNMASRAKGIPLYRRKPDPIPPGYAYSPVSTERCAPNSENR